MKNCPFCGRPARKFRNSHGDHLAKCENEECGNGYKPSMLIDDWNSRPLEDALQAEVDRLKGELTEARDKITDLESQVETLMEEM